MDSAKTQAQPPRLSPLLPTHTGSHEATLTDEWVTDDAGPIGQGPWLDEIKGRVQHLCQTVSKTDG
jgi:hypothetical protein